MSGLDLRPEGSGLKGVGSRVWDFGLSPKPTDCVDFFVSNVCRLSSFSLQVCWPSLTSADGSEQLRKGAPTLVSEHVWDNK